MLDFGISELMVIGAVALVVIGPERLPKVARTVGHLVGKAQRYVSDVKAEVNRSIELDELRKVKTQFEDAARDAHNTVRGGIDATRTDFEKTWSDATSGLSNDAPDGPQAPLGDHYDTAYHHAPLSTPPMQPVRKNWRLKRTAVPAWYKHRHGVRMHAQSGAARVARFRPSRG